MGLGQIQREQAPTARVPAYWHQALAMAALAPRGSAPTECCRSSTHYLPCRTLARTRRNNGLTVMDRGRRGRTQIGRSLHEPGHAVTALTRTLPCRVKGDSALAWTGNAVA